jgi:hypothetical protein
MARLESLQLHVKFVDNPVRAAGSGLVQKDGAAFVSYLDASYPILMNASRKQYPQ